MSAVSTRSRDPLREAVFAAVYRSPEQRRRRVLAGVVLGLKHALRGVAFSWPLYLPAAAPLAIPEAAAWWSLPLLIPGIGLSLHILRKGVREDYANRVRGVLLGAHVLRAMLTAPRA